MNLFPYASAIALSFAGVALLSSAFILNFMQFTVKTSAEMMPCLIAFFFPEAVFHGSIYIYSFSFFFHLFVLCPFLHFFSYCSIMVCFPMSHFSFSFPQVNFPSTYLLFVSLIYNFGSKHSFLLFTTAPFVFVLLLYILL